MTERRELVRELRRTCAGCSNPLPGWPVVVACCGECWAWLPEALRAGCTGPHGTMSAHGVDDARKWLRNNPRDG